MFFSRKRTKVFYGYYQNYRELSKKKNNIRKKEHHFYKELEDIPSIGKNNKYYPIKYHNVILKKARTFFKKKRYIIHIRKNNLFNELWEYIQKNLKYKKTFYIVKTKYYVKVGNNEISERIEDIFRYKSDGLQSICFIFKKQ